MNGTKICAVDGCHNPVRCQSLCGNHYGKWRRRNPDVVLPKKSAEERFWEKVDKTGNCWEWIPSREAGGYGTFLLEGKVRKAHTVALEWAVGKKRPIDLDTCHRCDNPSCVRPSHLYFGTRQQNIDDAWARGRMQIGSERPAAKITEIDVLAIRNEYAAGAEVLDLVNHYGLKDSTIRGIVLGFKWKHVGGPITRRRANKKAA